MSMPTAFLSSTTIYILHPFVLENADIVVSIMSKSDKELLNSKVFPSTSLISYKT